jgi:hypothetical protein
MLVVTSGIEISAAHTLHSAFCHDLANQVLADNDNCSASPTCLLCVPLPSYLLHLQSVPHAFIVALDRQKMVISSKFVMFD